VLAAGDDGNSGGDYLPTAVRPHPLAVAELFFAATSDISHLIGHSFCLPQMFEKLASRACRKSPGQSLPAVLGACGLSPAAFRKYVFLDKKVPEDTDEAIAAGFAKFEVRFMDL